MLAIMLLFLSTCFTVHGIDTGETNYFMDLVSFVVEMDLNVTKTIDLNDLLPDVKNATQTKVFNLLFSSPSLIDSNGQILLKNVNMDISALVRRRKLNEFDAGSDTKLVTVEIDGLAQYEVDINGLTLKETRLKVKEELEDILTIEELKPAILFFVPNLYDVASIEIKEIDAGDEDDDDKAANDDQDGGNGDDDAPASQKPSMLSLIFGFTLLGLTVASLIGWTYIFCRKWNKKKRKQEKEVLPYQRPAAKSRPIPQQRPKPIIRRPQVETIDDDSSSDDSPYRGLENKPAVAPQAANSEEQAVDSFARELEAAASQDEQEWIEFKQKKGKGKFVDMNDQKVEPWAAGAKGDWRPSAFPYGDEKGDQNVEWGVGSDNVDNWEPYNALKAEEEKKDAWGTGSTFSVPSETSQDAFGRNALQFQANKRDDDKVSVVSSEASSMMMEVKNLSKYVQRYDKRKERKFQRVVKPNDDDDLDMDYLNQIRNSLGQRTTTPKQNQQFEDFEEPSFGLSPSDDSPPNNKRLGITPIKEEKEPRPELKRHSTSAAQLGYQKFAANRRRAQSEGDARKPNLKNLRGYQSIVEEKKQRLANLRSSSAIIDASKSDVNVGGFDTVDIAPERSKEKPKQAAKPAAPKPVAWPTVPTTYVKPAPKPVQKPAEPPKPPVAPSRSFSAPKVNNNNNSKFSGARAMFENKPQNAIFPPGGRLF